MAKAIAVVVLLLLNSLGPVTGIKLNGNGYTDILIAINPAVPENEELINEIKEMITSGSEYLYHALDNLVFFKEVKILVPPTWKGTYERARRETYDKANVRIDRPNKAHGNDPYTEQRKGCGEEGEYIHFTPDFLMSDESTSPYGPRGRVFVHEWAHLRWGVFDEYNEDQPFYMSENGVQNTRCTGEIKGRRYEIIHGRHKPCTYDEAGLPTKECKFFPDKEQEISSSVMFMQSIDSVKAFCSLIDHNPDAPNMQNKKCDNKATRTVIFEDSVDSDALRTLPALQSLPPPPTFQVIQRQQRVVCLILDVSGSMQGDRQFRQLQAAALFLREIVEEGSYVAIVKFSTNADIISSLTKIDGKARESLISKLPKGVGGSTNMCTGLQLGFQVLQQDDKSAVGDNVIFLTDGEATDDVQSCLQSAVDSGAIINTIALGPDASKVLKDMADSTDGKFVIADESLVSNQLVNVFSSFTTSDGDSTKQTFQLESTGRVVQDWFNATTIIDRTVGNSTTFTVIYERRAPAVYIQSPSGVVYDQSHITDNTATKTITLSIPGTAESGDWKYSFLNRESSPQSMSLTVTSRSFSDDIPPIMVEAKMSQLTSDGSKLMVVLAKVSQNYLPVLGAKVIATLESDTGHSVEIELVDKGAEPDHLKDDGTYSKYFTRVNNGRYNLKVQVKHQKVAVSGSPSRLSGALYVPGYIVDGEVQLNPEKPPVQMQAADVGSFTRTATGESFVVSLPPGVPPPKFPPSKITDLSAEIQEDTLLLNWTAPGEDLDQGTAKSYEIRWSERLEMLQKNFSDANPVNTSALQPQEAGSDEQFSFLPNVTIQNGTTVFLAVRSEDNQALKSEISNVVRVTKFVSSPPPQEIPKPGLNLAAIVVTVCVVTMVAFLIAAVIRCVMNRRKTGKITTDSLENYHKRVVPYDIRVMLWASHFSSAVMAKVVAVVVVLLLLLDALGPVTGIRLDGNGYTDILIAINPAVPENANLINQIKAMITSGSEYLLKALDNKVFIKEVKILVPPNWSGSYQRARTETYDKANIIIDQPHPAHGNDPYTKQMKGCGEESEYIHFTPDFLLHDELLKAYGPRGKVFVHEWAHLRWGVFDEYNENEPFYFSSNQRIQPTRSCSKDLSGQWFEMIGGKPKLCSYEDTGLPNKDCQFFPDKDQQTNASIMYLQSIDSVTTFCHEDEHNVEAPNMQNQKCNSKATRTVIFQDSVDKNAFQILKPLQSPPPAPTFKLVQRRGQVICLILDVSGSMSGARILRLQQAATIFLREIVEEGAHVGIVKFSTNADILSSLTKIDSKASRDSLIGKLPTNAAGSTNMCTGLKLGIEVLQQDDNSAVGDNLIFLTDGEASDNVQSCLQSAVDSGAIINTIALGPSASDVLRTMANRTDGKFIVADENLISNQLVDAFSSFTLSDGDPTKQTIQLVSSGSATTGWFNGTVPIDRTVGNGTTFTVIYEKSAPTVYIQSPNGSVYGQTHITDNAATKTITLNIPGTAEPGDWKFSFLNKGSTAQTMTLTVTSRAARSNVPPVMVQAQMNQLTTDGSKPLVVFAEVSQNYRPVLGAKVLATLQSDTGHSEELYLLDNGAGADNLKNDGIYSRYFTKLKNGRYSLKVQVIHHDGAISGSPSKHSGAMYVPGYMVDGKVQLNPKKPPVSVQPADVGSFTRTATGESFVVSVPQGVIPKFPPSKITDLRAEIHEDTLSLNWTAPGEDFDQGTDSGLRISSAVMAKVVAVVVVLLLLNALGPVTGIKLDGNGYTDILIAINPAVPESKELINQIEGMIINGSEYLFQALDKKVFIKEVKILVPSEWNGTYHKASRETYEKAKIVIDFSELGDFPYTNKMKGCGQEGEKIFFTPNFLLNDTLLNPYGPRGADIEKDDGIYSRFFTNFKTGRYSLKVDVRVHEDTKKEFSLNTYSGALYMPGYIENGQVKLNPPKPPVSMKSADVGSFTRTTTGESFVVSVPPGVTPPNFPPNKITDLSAEIQEDNVLLSWTAPGEDFDQGTAESYEIRWSERLTVLQNHFSNANLVNTSALQPQESGLDERYSFSPDVPIQNGTTLFFAIQSEDKDTVKSEISNIARATKFVPTPTPLVVSTPGLNIIAIVIPVCVVSGVVACLIAAVTIRARNQKTVYNVMQRTLGLDYQTTRTVTIMAFIFERWLRASRFSSAVMAKVDAVVVLLLLNALGPTTGIRLDGNGYTDILVAINPAVPENEELINQIERMIINGSEYLFQALDKKVFIKEVKILVPPNWNGTYHKARRETYKRAKIIINLPDQGQGDDPYTNRLKGCGEEGEYIQFTPDFLLDDTLLNAYGPRGRVFVHEWAHLRWGVFDEYNEKEPFYFSTTQEIQPTRSCTNQISGQWFEPVNGNSLPCRSDVRTGLPTKECQFFPDRDQQTNASIMYLQSIDSVTTFCSEEEHNAEAPNLQNQKCNNKATRTVIFQDSVDKDALRSLTPLQSSPPAPTFLVIQRRQRAVVLILDVSGSMRGQRILRLQQAAALFLRDIVEEEASVAIVQFSTDARIISPLAKIEGMASRENLIRQLPATASGSTNMCKGLAKGFEALRKDDGSTIGDDVVFLTDGEATDNVADCLDSAVDSGAIVNTLALGPSASNVLITMANLTEGRFVVANETLLSNQLVEAFSSLALSDGDPIKQTIQLVSTGTSTFDWFNGTVPIDHTIGNSTTFTVLYERSEPSVYIESPSGSVYNQTDATHNTATKTITLNIPGTAEPGNWKYSFLNRELTAQTITLTVTSRPARHDVYPVTVDATMSQLTSDGRNPLVVFAVVKQGSLPVLGVNVTATLQSDTGHTVQLYLLDNGAGADVDKDDGIYSRYFTKLRTGRYSLKVDVRDFVDVRKKLLLNKYSGALYVPGYIVDGQVELNPPKPPVSVQSADVGSFTRTATGESFVVSVPPGVTPPNFPPNKITDLSAEIQEDTLLLSWTAPGEDLDQGTAESYEIRWSERLEVLQNNFSSANLVNTSALQPQESGLDERYSFSPDVPIQNGTTLYFAIQSEDKDTVKSEISNIARATKFVPSPRPSIVPITIPGLNLTVIVISACAVTM
ncbi:hypothetical protein NFI96_015881, partial [Prochilodus magdalenae]